jgi:hypothetical protein
MKRSVDTSPYLGVGWNRKHQKGLGGSMIGRPALAGIGGLFNLGGSGQSGGISNMLRSFKLSRLLSVNTWSEKKRADREPHHLELEKAQKHFKFLTEGRVDSKLK